MASGVTHIHERPTHAERTWNEKKIAGLLFNSRKVQATIDLDYSERSSAAGR
jgi:hypothetical protein